MTQQSALYIVATPIGNLGDMTYRAIEILQKVNVIAAEDTRHSAKLLSHYSIATSLIAYHDHTNEAKVEQLLSRLEGGESIALISDAGTPLISDPGFRLVHLARERGVKVVPVPGASALVSALSAAGLPSDRFSFEGFLPAKTSGRKSILSDLAKDPRTIIFYESPHRIKDSLVDMRAVLGGERLVVLAREITKTFETFIYGSLDELVARVLEDENQSKGEIVVLLHGYRREQEGGGVSEDAKRLISLLVEELPVKKAAAITAKFTGDKKNTLYQWVLDSKNDAQGQ